jgi:hypothetical protein
MILRAMSVESFGAIAWSAVEGKLVLGAGGEMSPASCGLYALRALLKAASEFGSVLAIGCSRNWDPGSFCVSTAADSLLFFLLDLITDKRSSGSSSLFAMADGIFQ